MPATGLSTLSILLVGQLIDIDADKKGGKHGVASRLGTRATSIIYVIVQLGIVANILLLVFLYPGNTWMLLLALVPYLVLFPQAVKIILKNHNKEDELKKGAKLTVLTHIVFSFFLIVGLVLYLSLN